MQVDNKMVLHAQRVLFAESCVREKFISLKRTTSIRAKFLQRPVPVCVASSSSPECSSLATPVSISHFPCLIPASLVPYFLAASPAWAAAEGLSTYDPSAQSEFITNIVGVLYCGLVGYFLYKLYRRRADKFTSEACPSHTSITNIKP